ncbi:DAK2 domain-containing protein [Candidatus Saccharibacteria bacterium]|nr:DAK2 domain-containing protein [Candidatus Saccharibacteria bacterium]
MNTLKLNGALFADMIRCGAKNLAEKKEIVNELNVFPVPDGDTGDNMSLTINSAASSEDIDDPVSLAKTSDAVMRAVLLGARGNSGVILSRIFAGLAKGLEGKVEANLQEFDNAMKMAVSEAYSAVAKPVEGTILTVIRDGVNSAHKEMTSETTFEDYFEFLAREMKRSVDRTPELLPSLKEAGVVDSGGVGLLYIFEGMQFAFDGEKVDADFLKTRKNEFEELDISLFTEDSELEFGYCTEFLLRLQNKKTNISEFSVDDFTNYLKSVGDSVVCFKDGSVVKAHVHTKNPGEVLNHCQQLGEFLKLKIENMSLQHNNSVIRNTYSVQNIAPRKKYGIVTVANGKGVVDTFKELGCDVVIPGGQSMNPSTSDFVDAFNQINAETIFVFPNNKNIIMTAEQASEATEKDIRVIKTKTIGEGYSAISMFDTNAEDINTLIDELNGIVSGVVTGQVSQASRDTKMDGLDIKQGDFLGFSDGRILVDKKERKDIIPELAEKLGAENFDICILFYGENVGENEAKEMEKILKEKYNRLEFYLLDGGQPIYDYILILE